MQSKVLAVNRLIERKTLIIGTRAAYIMCQFLILLPEIGEIGKHTCATIVCIHCIVRFYLFAYYYIEPSDCEFANKFVDGIRRFIYGPPFLLSDMYKAGQRQVYEFIHVQGSMESVSISWCNMQALSSIFLIVILITTFLLQFAIAKKKKL